MTRWILLFALFTSSLLAFATTSRGATPSKSTSLLFPVLAQAQPVEPAGNDLPGATPDLSRSSDEFAHKFETMSMPAKISYFLGLLVCVVGGIWMLVKGFQESLPWGFGMILCGIVSLVFLVMHWDKAKNPFFVQLVGIALMLLGLMVLK